MRALPGEAQAGRGAPGRLPVIRGWEGTLTIEGKNILFVPNEGSKSKLEKIPIEKGEDMVEFWQKILACCRSRQKETDSPADLAYHAQTALIMGMMAFQKEKTARFDPSKEKILL